MYFYIHPVYLSNIYYIHNNIELAEKFEKGLPNRQYLLVNRFLPDRCFPEQKSRGNRHTQFLYCVAVLLLWRPFGHRSGRFCYPPAPLESLKRYPGNKKQNIIISSGTAVPPDIYVHGSMSQYNISYLLTYVYAGFLFTTK